MVKKKFRFPEKRMFLILVAMCLLGVTQAQTVISGIIRDINKKGVPDVSVILYKVADSTVVGYNFSNSNGSYQIIYQGNENHLLLSVSGFNVKKQEKAIDNHSQVVDFIIEESSIELKEVLIKSAKTWGTRDTINYSVPAFADKTDRVIGDVLKKLPGIEVAESGMISYQGKPISNFYIENLDMLQGRYGIATNNISVNDIATVQVFENHQPIKALEDIRFSQGAAINLKIKEGAKGIYSIMAELGIGYDKELLWQNTLTGMYFSKKSQHIYTYKGNNTGEDIFKELQSFTIDNPSGNNQLTYILSPIAPDITKGRYYFNNSNAASLNNINKFKNGSDLCYNIIYLNDFETRNSFSKTSFIIPETGTTTLLEDLYSTSGTNHLEGELNFHRNDTNNYLKAFLNISGNWEKRNGRVINPDQIDQTLLNNAFSVSNSIFWIRRKEKNARKGFEFNSSNFYKTQPHELLIHDGLYPEIFNNNNPYPSLRQNVLFDSFITRNFISLLSAMVLGDLHINPTAHFNIENQSLQSSIYKNLPNNSEVEMLDANTRNQQNWTRITTGVSLYFSYSSNDLELNASLPLNYQMIYLSDGSRSVNSQKSKFNLKPNVSFTYDISSRFKLSGGYNFFNQSPDLHTLYSGYILQNYRSLNSYENKLSDIYFNGGNLKFAYKNIMEMLFAGVGISYNHFNSDVIHGQFFDGILIKTTLVEMPNSGENMSLNAQFSKGFNWKGLVVSIEGSWGKGSSPQYRQDKLVQYINQGVNLSNNMYIKISPRVFFNNKNTWSVINGKTNTRERLSSMQTFISASSVEVVLPGEIVFNATCEYYFNRMGENNKNFALADAGINYTWKKLRFSFDWKNILNTRTYLSAYYGNMNSYYSEYGIRPSSALLKVQLKIK